MNMENKSIGVLFRRLMMGLLVMGILSPVCANNDGSVRSEEIDKLVENVRFQFQPDLVQPDKEQLAKIQGYFNNTPGFPLWLMMDMGGAVLIDKEHFSINSSVKDDDGVWILNVSCVDSVNGFFQLDFAIDSKSGKSILKISTAGVGKIALYMGKIQPYEGSCIDFESDKFSEKDKQNVEVLDRIIPEINFTVKLKSELYGNRARIIVTPKKVKIVSAKNLDAEIFDVVCCEKQNDVWYVRIKVGEQTMITEDMYVDLAINASTAAVNYRMGFADKLKFDWRVIVDGKVMMP